MNKLKNIFLFASAVAMSFAGAAQEMRLGIVEAVKYAELNNNNIKVQEFEQKKAREGVRMASAGLKPQINAGAGYARYFDRQVIFMPGSFLGTPQLPVADVQVGGLNAANAYIAMTQPVLDLGSYAQRRISKIDNSIESRRLNKVNEQVKTEVYKQYMALLIIDRQLAAMQRSLDRNERALLDAKSLYSQGKSLRTDTLNSFISLQNVLSAIAVLENQKQSAMFDFKRMLGVESALNLVLADTNLLHIDEQGPLQLDIQTGIAASNHDVAIAQMLVDKKAREYSKATLSRLPKLSAAGQYQVQTQNDKWQVRNYSWPRTSFVGLQLSVPIYGGGALNAQNKIKKYELMQERFMLKDLKQKVEDEAIVVQQTIKDLKFQHSIHTSNLIASQISFNIIRERYIEGMSTHLELADAELAVTKAEIELFMSIYNLRSVELDLKLLTGAPIL